DVPPDTVLRKQLEKKTAAQLFTLLEKRDPKRAQAMDTPSEQNNKVRLIRALEIAQTKVRPSSIDTKVGPSPDVLWIGIAPPMKDLEKNINMRLAARMKKGM